MFDEHEPDEQDDIWDEIGYIEEATKRLIRRHEVEYRKFVEEIDIERLHRQIERQKGEIYRRDREIARLNAKNPRGVHVPALEATVAALMVVAEKREEK